MSNISPDAASDPNTSAGGPLESTSPIPDDHKALASVTLTLTAELGRRSIDLGELLRLKVDDIVTLARPTGEDVDLVAGNILIGKAELLASGEKLAVRLAELAGHASVLPGEPLQFEAGGSCRLTNGRRS